MTEQSTQRPDQSSAPVPPDFRALCAKVIQYNEGQGKYNFSQLNALDREDAAFDAWQEIRSEIKHALAQPVPPQPVAEALAARPLLEKVARMADRIGQHTVGEIMAISDRAAAWLTENPPGQPVAIEPRGCPTPGACSCVEPQPMLAEEPIDRSQLSDGYHTFAELYEHRHALMLAFMRAAPELCWCSTRHAGGELPFGTDEWFIVGAQLPTGAITYHLPAALWEAACVTGAAVLEQGRPWDGHTAHDVVKRLTQWAAQPSEAEPVPAREMADVHYEWELEDASGDWQAGGSANSLDDVERESLRYLHTYAQDGPYKLIIRQHWTKTINEFTAGDNQQ